LSVVLPDLFVLESVIDALEIVYGDVLLIQAVFKLEFTPEMKRNLVRFAKENAKEYLEKQNENLVDPSKSVESKPKRTA